MARERIKVEVTVGRIVHYHPDKTDQPQAAIVSRVHDDLGTVDLHVFGPFETSIKYGVEHPGLESIDGKYLAADLAGRWSWPPRA